MDTKSEIPIAGGIWPDDKENDENAVRIVPIDIQPEHHLALSVPCKAYGVSISLDHILYAVYGFAVSGG